MKDIKTKDSGNKGIKTLDKVNTWTERIKDPVAFLNKQSKEYGNDDIDINDYGTDKIKYYTNRVKDETVHGFKISVDKSNKMIKNKMNSHKIRNGRVGKIKTKSFKNVQKTAKASKHVFNQGKKLAIRMARMSQKILFAIAKGLVLGVKALIGALSSLIGILASGGAVVLIVVVLICLIGMLLGSVFGIFFSNDSDSRTMTSVISEINQEVYRRAETEKLFAKADEIVFESTYSNWKDIIAVYSVKYSNVESEDAQVVMYLDDKNVSHLKTVFYDFNTITTSVRTESKDDSIASPSFNTNPIQSSNNEKSVLYVNVTSKSLDEIMNIYNFSDEQKKQIKELTSSEYDDMWSHLLYGSETGEYIYWRQKGASWSNIQLGNSGKTIGDIGCLTTSVAILIQKSGVTNPITPFNPGSFVESLNKNNGFDSNGNLQYAAISKGVPDFQYVGRVTLVGKTQKQKLELIKQYQNQGFYLAMEVLGDTGQHWVAIMNVVGNEIKMVDPSTDNIDVWNTYNWKNSSQFVYFQANLAS